MNCYQDEFDQTNGLRYLNHAAVAPWPRRAADAVSELRWTDPGRNLE